MHPCHARFPVWITGILAKDLVIAWLGNSVLSQAQDTPDSSARRRNVTQEIDMTGLRRTPPDRQGNPMPLKMPRTTKAEGASQSEIQKLLRPSLSAADQRKVCVY